MLEFQKWRWPSCGASSGAPSGGARPPESRNNTNEDDNNGIPTFALAFDHIMMLGNLLSMVEEVEMDQFLIQSWIP
jgi:hypothetical protein